MQGEPTEKRDKPIAAAICIDDVVYGRFRAVLRHLCVGLIDVISSVRLVTSTAEAQSLTLGPVQTVLFQALQWPFKAQRFGKLSEALSARPPTVVHAISAGSFEVAEKIAAEFDADLVYQVTALEDVSALMASRYHGPHRVICSSRPLLAHHVEMAGAKESDVALIRPGVVCAAEPTCFSEEHRAPTVLSTASLTAEGGVDALLHAIHQLKGRGHEFLTFLLGSGPNEPQLRRTAKELGLGSTTVFAEPVGNVLRAMVGADIFVVPSIERSISARCLQALGHGMAVVAVAGGVYDAYLPGQTALLAEAPTATDLASAVEKLLLDRTLARSLASGAIEHMRRHHTMTAMAELTAEVYRTMAVRRSTYSIKQRKQA